MTLKAGANRLAPGILPVFLSWRIPLGVVLFLLSSVLFVAGLKNGSLTTLYPLVALGYVWTLFWSRLFFLNDRCQGCVGVRQRHELADWQER